MIGLNGKTDSKAAINVIVRQFDCDTSPDMHVSHMTRLDEVAMLQGLFCGLFNKDSYRL